MKTKIKRLIELNLEFIVVMSFALVLSGVVVYNSLKHGIASL